MPPQPGLFAVPLGASASHTSAGISSGPSSAATQLGTIPPVGPGMGIALVGGSSKNSRLDSQHNTFDQRDVPSSGPRTGVSKGSGEGYGQGHQQHQHSHPNSHNHHSSHNAGAGPSSRNTMEDGRKEKKRKESTRTGKDTGDRRDDPRHYTESINALHTATHILSTRPETYELYRLRLYPLTIERSALLSQYEFEERYSIECAQVAYDEERERVEEEWRRGRERVRERLLEGIEERRRRAREEKEGEGTSGDAVLDAHSRPPITRKLRNKLGTSPPPTPQGNHHPLGLSNFAAIPGIAGGTLLAANVPITMGPFTNPHSLSVEDLPSPFPLPLTSSQLPHSSGGGGGAGAAASAAGTGAANGNRRRVKGGGAHQGQAIGGLGKSLLALNTNKDNDLENDLGEIRRGNKRRRATAAASMAKTGAGM